MGGRKVGPGLVGWVGGVGWGGVGDHFLSTLFVK